MSVDYDFLAPVVTYADAAVPARIRQEIEISLPCTGGFDHLWDRQSIANSDGAFVSWWECVHCGITANLDPRPITEQQRPLASAHLEDYLR